MEWIGRSGKNFQNKKIKSNVFLGSRWGRPELGEQTDQNNGGDGQ